MTTAQTAQGSTEARGWYKALARGWDAWTVGFTVGLGQAPRQVSVRPRDLPGLLAQVAHAKRRFGLPAEAPVPRVAEAGRDGFWRHRFLQAHGVHHVVVEAASLAGNRRYRRAKTDTLDVQKLLTMRVRFVVGETRRWNGVRVPSTADAGLRQPHRAWLARKEARTQPLTRMQGLLAGLGREAVIAPTFPERLLARRQGDGPPVPARLQERLLREVARWSLVQRQRPDLEKAEARWVRDDQQRPVEQVRTLRRVPGGGGPAARVLGPGGLGGRGRCERPGRPAPAGLPPAPS